MRLFVMWRAVRLLAFYDKIEAPQLARAYRDLPC